MTRREFMSAVIMAARSTGSLDRGFAHASELLEYHDDLLLRIRGEGDRVIIETSRMFTDREHFELERDWVDGIRCSSRRRSSSKVQPLPVNLFNIDIRCADVPCEVAVK